MGDRPLLCLAMIVKDEAHNLARTLASVRDHVDRWHVVDTGSTDGTQELVRREMDGLPGTLSDAPFVDFATTRNVALERAEAEDAPVFVLTLSADETLVDGAALRAFCERTRAAVDGGAFHVTVRSGPWTFPSSRLVRAGAGWRYAGVVHEGLFHPTGAAVAGVVPDALIVHVDSDPGRKRARFERDLALLAAQVARDPADARAAFYYAQTLDGLGRPADARVAYERRVALGGWVDEVFVAAFRVALAARAAGAPWPEVHHLLLDAHARDPSRAEPLRELARHYRAAQPENLPLAYLFAARGAACRPRPGALFVEADAVEACAFVASIAAWYLGEFAAGEAFARQALAAHPDDAQRRANLALYVARGGKGA